MKTSFYKITTILLMLLLLSSAYAQKNLLLINSDEGNPADDLLIEFLNFEGWTTTLLLSSDFGDAAWADAGTYADYDAVYIGEKLGSSSVYNFHAAGYPLPCVNTEGWAYKEAAGTKWGWLNDEDNQFHQLGSADGATAAEANTLIFFGDQETWLGRQYDANEELIYCSSTDPANGSNGIALDQVCDAIPIANLLAPTLDGKPVMWAIPAGTTITTDPNTTPLDVTLEYPMVYLGLIDVGQAEPTSEFHQLVSNCLKWVTGDYESSISDIETNALKVWPNPTNGIVNLSLTLPVSENIRINIYDITGSLVKNIDTEFLSAGYNTIDFDISEMNAAQYIYEIIAKDNILRGKICKY